jgi:hypothetical protein
MHGLTLDQAALSERLDGTQVDGCAVPGGNPEVYTNDLLLPYRVFMSAKRSC